ncbi:MAG: flagellar biosynthesis protein FlhB [Pikeienuella sp.]
MSEESASAGEKTHEPTPQRLEEARKRGDVPKSTDLSAAAAYFGLLVALGLAGAGAASSSGAVLAGYLARAETLAPRLLESGGGLSLQAAVEALAGLTPLFLLPFLFVILAILGQQALIFAPEKLAPKLNRISPVAQAKNKFGPTGLVEFAKSTAKLAVISAVLALFLMSETDRIIGLTRAAPRAIPAEMARLAFSLLTQVALVTLAVAVFDLLWQRFDHARKLRMTFEEVKEEVKRSEGDPMVKSQRRRRAEEIATNQMMVEVPKAAVVIVNPTHYAVALKWDRAGGGAPVVVAKGVDGVALRIREAAERAKVPIRHDPPTARALEAMVEIGAEIPPAHYQSVAAAIRFAEAMRARAKERGA